MARAGTDSDNANALIGLRKREDGLQPFAKRRKEAGKKPSGKTSKERLTAPDAWVRLDREGSFYTYYFSSDGQNWEKLRSQAITFPEELLVGLVLSAQDENEKEFKTEATFCNVMGWPGGVGPQFRRGDMDDNGLMNITDAVFLLNGLFGGGPNYTCAEAADADDDGKINLTDAVFVLNRLFGGGPVPPDPGPVNCGPDRGGSPADLGCDAYATC